MGLISAADDKADSDASSDLSKVTALRVARLGPEWRASGCITRQRPGQIVPCSAWCRLGLSGQPWEDLLLPLNSVLTSH